MTQTNQSTHTVRRIRRITQEELDELKTEYREFYSDRKQIWACEYNDSCIAYNPKTQALLDEAVQTGDQVFVDMGTGYQYRLDISGLIQFNLSTSRVRNMIQADPNGTVEIRGILGIPLHSHADF